MKRIGFLAILLAAIAAHALDYEAVRGRMQGATDAQWGAYAKSLVGVQVDWTGWVSDVKEQWGGKGYKVLIDMDPPGTLSVQDVYVEHVPEALALRLQKDQRVRVRGRIKTVHKVLGSCAVTLEDVQFLP